MKRWFVINLLLLTLVGCTNGMNSNNQSDESIVKSGAHTEDTPITINKDVYVPNPQVTDDINLVNVGETISDAKGELHLKAYKKVNETLKVGTVEMIIKEIKVMHFVPDYSMIDFFHAYTHDEEFDFIKVRVEIKNTSNDVTNFAPIAALKLNSGEYKTWEDDIYLEELTGIIEGNAVKKGNIGFILENTDNLKFVELLTSDAIDKKHKINEQGKQIKLDL